MKREILLSLCMVALVGAARGQTAAFYVNDGIVNSPPDVPPQIDAVNFVNNNFFQIQFTNFTMNPPLFYTSSTLNFTNRGTMNAFPGFELVNAPIGDGQKRMAANIVNTGTINVGTGSNVFIVAGGGVISSGLPKFLGSASNIVNPGVITIGFEGLCRLNGETINLNRGSLMMTNQGYEIINQFTTLFANGAYADGYWGTGVNLFNPRGQFESQLPMTPYHWVTNRDYLVTQEILAPSQPLAYVSDQVINSNRLVRAVFLSNTNLGYPSSVFFPLGGDIYLQWKGVTTDAFGYVRTNYLHLYDYIEDPAQPTAVYINGYAGVGLSRPTYVPGNFYFWREDWSLEELFTPASPGGVPPGTFPSAGNTNRYAAYEALFLPTTLVANDTASQDATNIPGRIEISASKALDLNRARISCLNYLSLQSTNQFMGSSHAQISSPYADINLRCTNGVMSISNLLVRALPMPEGAIRLYSTCWTNLVAGITNTYHVLYVDATIAPETPPRVQTLILRSTNTVAAVPGEDSLVIHDGLHVTRSMLLDSRRITVATNAPGAALECGAVDLYGMKIFWPNTTPRLQMLTNNGWIRTLNASFFGGTRSSPFYTSNYTEPYLSFVNRGGITNSGCLIWASHFENSGTFFTGVGDFQLQQCVGGILTNGSVLASNGLATFSAGGLLLSNHTVVGGSGLVLNATNVLSDGVANLATLEPAVQNVASVTNGNFWSCGGSLALPIRAARGDLLGTTIRVVAPANAEVPIQWAGEDRGSDVYSPTRSGFMNNAALGRLVLEGYDGESLFHFVNPRADHGPVAMYVDCLELWNVTATNFNGDGILEGVKLDPNVKVYFAQALANGVCVAEKLAGRAGFTWVSNYNCGYFSSTNLIYPDGSTNRVNTALAQSCDLDSNGNGIVNCMDPAPVPLTTWRPVGSNVVTNLAEIAPAVVDHGPGAPEPVTPDPILTNEPPVIVKTLPTLALPPSADFLPSGSLAAAQGSYAGLFAEDNGVSLGSAGYLSASVAARGTYSGKLLLGGRSYSFSGKFNAAGQATNLVRRGSSSTLTLALQADLNGGDQLRGTVADGARWTAIVHADRLVFNKTKRPATSNGRTASYTMVVPPTSDGPAAYGFGSAKVSVSGAVQWSGTLADGTKVSQSTSLAKDGFYPLYVSLYSGKGLAIGWLQFTNLPDGDLGGAVVWLKPAGVSTAYYAAGVTNAFPVTGAVYTAPASGQRLLGASNYEVVFRNGAQVFTNAFALDARNRVVRPAGSRLSLTFTTASGLFQGSSLNPATGKTFTFSGALLESQAGGFGLYKGTNQVGQVLVTPLP